MNILLLKYKEKLKIKDEDKMKFSEIQMINQFRKGVINKNSLLFKNNYKSNNENYVFFGKSFLKRDLWDNTVLQNILKDNKKNKEEESPSLVNKNNNKNENDNKNKNSDNKKINNVLKTEDIGVSFFNRNIMSFCRKYSNSNTNNRNNSIGKKENTFINKEFIRGKKIEYSNLNKNTDYEIKIEHKNNGNNSRNRNYYFNHNIKNGTLNLTKKIKLPLMNLNTDEINPSLLFRQKNYDYTEE